MAGLDTRETIILRCGKPGHGKTWSLCKYLVHDFLPNHDGKIFTNVPLNPEAIANYIARVPHGLIGTRIDHEKKAKVLERIVLIPEDEQEKWQRQERGIKDYFDDVAAAAEGETTHPLSRAIIVIDEARKFIPSTGKASTGHTLEFDKFVSTLRHYGARLCLVMQDESQIAKSIRVLAAKILRVTNLRDISDPVTGTPIDHWSQLAAKIIGQYYAWVREDELIAEGEDYISTPCYTGLMWPLYFQFYNSHNNIGEASGEEEPPQYKRFGWIRFLVWLFEANWFAWSWRLAALTAVWIGLMILFEAIRIGMGETIVQPNAEIKTETNQPAGQGGGATVGAIAAATPSAPVVELPQLVGIIGEFAIYNNGTEAVKNETWQGKELENINRTKRRVYYRDGTYDQLPIWKAGQAAAAVPIAAAPATGAPPPEPTSAPFNPDNHPPIPLPGQAATPNLNFSQRNFGATPGVPALQGIRSDNPSRIPSQ